MEIEDLPRAANPKRIRPHPTPSGIIPATRSGLIARRKPAISASKIPEAIQIRAARRGKGSEAMSINPAIAQEDKQAAE
jgi:hypothetical protein